MSVPKEQIAEQYRSVFQDEKGQFTEEGHKKLTQVFDTKKKVEELLSFVNDHSPAAMYDLATCYLHGYLGLTRDLKKAFDLTYKAAQLNYSLAQFSLTEYCANKRKIPSEYVRTGKDEKDRIEQFNDVKPSDQNYFTWLKKAADGGLGIAECFLAAWYLKNTSIPDHRIFSKSLLESAERKGLAQARNLIKKFFNDPKTEPSDKKSDTLGTTSQPPQKIDSPKKSVKSEAGILFIFQQQLKDKQTQIAVLTSQDALLDKECSLMQTKLQSLKELKKLQTLKLSELDKEEQQLSACLTAQHKHSAKSMDLDSDKTQSDLSRAFSSSQ